MSIGIIRMTWADGTPQGYFETYPKEAIAMSERPVIKFIGIGDVDSSKFGGADHIHLDRGASQEMIDEAASEADMLWIVADAADSKLAEEIGRASSDSLTIALLKGSPDPDIQTSLESTVDAYASAPSDADLAEACAGASAISELVRGAGTVSMALDDVKQVLHRAGRIIISAGEGKDLADAARAALRNIHQHKDLAPIGRVLCRIDTDPDVSLLDITNVLGIISEASAPDATMLWGHVADPDMHGKVKIVIVAGFKSIFK